MTDLQDQSIPTWYFVALVLSLMALAILACGGSSSSLIGQGELDPTSQIIAGLPQFVAPSSTPVPTSTQVPTDVHADIYIPPGGYVTNTPSGWMIRVCNPACIWVTATPYGGMYSTPPHTIPGPTSTPRSTYTPYPTPTPCISSFIYYFGEEVFTDPSPDNLTLGIVLGNVRTFASQRDGFQIAAWTVEIRNLGRVDYLLFAPFQIYVAGINNVLTNYNSSEAAAREVGANLHEAVLDGYLLEAGESVRFDMFAYTAQGQVTDLAYILNPYANGFDGTIAGGNIAYWQSGERTGCRGRIDDNYTPLPNLTPQPTATETATPSFQVN